MKKLLTLNQSSIINHQTLLRQKIYLILLFVFLNSYSAFSLCNPQPTIYINSYVTYNSSMSVFSDIEIQSGGTLDITGATIGIISGGHIRVKNGGYLIVSGSTISNACTYMWGGIYVENGGRVAISSSTIENAEFALELEPYTDTDIQKSIFDKNYIGIYTKPQSTPTVFLSFYLSDVSFTCSNTLIPNSQTTASKTFAGIYFNNTNTVIEGANDQLNFNDLNIGICLIESNIDVKNCYFEKIQPDAIYGDFFDGSAIYANGTNGNYYLTVTGLAFSFTPVTINNCNFGVYAVTMNTEVINCTMEEVVEGIVVVKCPNQIVKLHENIIYASKYGMNLQYNDLVQEMSVHHNSIYMNWAGGGGGIGINVLDKGLAPTANKFFYYNQVSSYSAYGGVLMTDVNYSSTIQCDIYFYDNIPAFGWKFQGGKGNFLKCNSVTKTVAQENTQDCLYCFVESGDPVVKCNVALGGEVGMRFTGNCGYVYLRENTFQDNLDAGLFLGSTAIIGPQNNHVNQWINTVSSTTAMCASCPYNLSLFKVQNYLPYEPVTITPSSGWFGNTPNNPHLLCSTLTCTEALDANNEITQEEQFLLDHGSLGLTEFSDEMDEYVRQEIFEKVSKMSPSERTAQLQLFYSSYLSSNIANFQNMKDALSVNALSETDINTFNSNTNLIKQKINEGNLIGEQLKDTAIAQNDKDSLKIILLSHLTQIENKYSESATLALSLVPGQESINSTAEQINSGILSSNLIYTNQKTVDEIYLNTIAKGIYELSTIQIMELEDIANQCPLAGGDAVFQARGILALDTRNLNYNDYDACNSIGITFRKRTSIEPTIKVYPNPANDKVTLKINSEDNQTYHINLYDVFGKIVLSRNLNGKNIEEQIDLTEVLSGVYLYDVVSLTNQYKGYIIRN